MRFANDLVRQKFHELPTDTQLQYVRLDETLAKVEKVVMIESVMHDENILEMIIRISEKFYGHVIT